MWAGGYFMACNECMATFAVRAHKATSCSWVCVSVGVYYLWHICIVNADTDGWQQAHGHRIFQKGKIMMGGQRYTRGPYAILILMLCTVLPSKFVNF